VLFAVYVGGAGGVVVGIVEARAISRAVEAERAAVRAERAATHRKWLDYLNGLLRHEVLNNASIIQGYAMLLLEEDDLAPSAREYVETIHHQSKDMTDVVQDVRIPIRAADRTGGFAPVDVEAELEDLRAMYRDVETDLAVDREGDAYVLADDLLPRVFSNLFTNAVEHNVGGAPRVEMTVETTPEVVAVGVADNGPGIPKSDRQRLFERGVGDHGLGLYLVWELLDRYDGTIELADTGPEGSVFTVELPRTAPPEDG
jgi:signal transduction histidine kinase